LRADVTDPAEAEGLVRGAAEALGRLAVLVNNVGNYVHKPLLDLELSEWHDMLDSNLSAAFYTCRVAVPLMRPLGGRIVNVGYAGAQNLVARPGITAYAIAKTGLLLLTKAVAKAEMRNRITANLVSPGVIENSVSKPVADIPAGRVGTVEEVAAAVLYLVSPEAAYVTGQTVEVAGGWNL
jgi:NAD(P)-dependent dehydrogenase (short-subunit alcohol dehydrogenase family)